MAVFIIILSILLWLAALAALLRRQIAAPALGYLGLLCLSFAKDGNLPLLPISPSILWGWLAMTAVVTMAVLLQPSAVRDEPGSAPLPDTSSITFWPKVSQRP